MLSNAVKLEQQRESVLLEYKHLKQTARLNGKELVYSNQKAAAKECLSHFKDGKQLVLLQAQPGTGKTGTVLELTKRLTTHKKDKHCVMINDIYTISGMNDKNWAEQFTEKMLPSFKGNILHRGILMKNAEKIEQIRDGYIINDECHYASGKNMTVSKVLKSSGLTDCNVAMDRKVKMLKISATPEAVAWDIKEWGDKAATVRLLPGPSYKGFGVMLSENRIRQAPEFSTYDEVQEWFQLFEDRYKNTSSKYFPIRLNKSAKNWADIRGFIHKATVEFGWNLRVHDSESRVNDIDEMMSSAPEKHTIILIKGFWRASKRLVRIHVGGSYEYVPKTTNMTSASQSLPGRFCDNYEYEGDELDPDLRPIHFGDKEAIKKYLEWFDNGCDYRESDYLCSNLKAVNGNIKSKPSMIHSSNMTNLDAVKVENVIDPWIVVHDELYPSYEAAREFLISVKDVMGINIKSSERNPIKIIDGFAVTTKLTKISEMSKESRVIGKNKIGKGSCIVISKDKTQGSYLIVPYYESEESKPEEVKFEVRYYDKNIYKKHEDEKQAKKKKKEEMLDMIGGGK